MSSIVTTQLYPVCGGQNRVTGQRIIQNLVAGNNIITHNLGLIDPRIILDSRINSTGAELDIRVVDEASNTITVFAAVATTNARLTIFPINK